MGYGLRSQHMLAGAAFALVLGKPGAGATQQAVLFAQRICPYTDVVRFEILAVDERGDCAAHSVRAETPAVVDADFALVVSGMGCAVLWYSASYLDEHAHDHGRFYAFLLLFMAAMLGVVLSDNLLLLVVFWELTSLASFLLIGYWHQRPDARQGALTASLRLTRSPIRCSMSARRAK